MNPYEKFSDIADSERDIGFFNNITSTVKNHENIAKILAQNQCDIASLIHPCVDLEYVQYGEGCYIPEGCVIGANVRIGDYFTCRLKSLISHDAIVGDFVFVGAGVTCCGRSVLESKCFIGGGATVSSGVRIGEGAVIGAGAIVVRDIPPYSVAYGNPAKVTRKVRETEKVV